MGYQVSAAVEAEMDAVKRVTTEITKLKKRKLTVIIITICRIIFNYKYFFFVYL